MSFLNDLTLQQIITRGLAYFLFAALYGGLLMLFLRGGPRRAGTGRAALAPPRISVWGLFMAVLFRAGWILPPATPSNARRLPLFLAVAGASACMLALIPALDLLRPLLPAGPDGAWTRFALVLIDQLQEVTLGSAILVLLPWPALPGRLLIVALFPGLAERLGACEGPATLIFVAAMVAVFEPNWLQQAMPLLSLVR